LYAGLALAFTKDGRRLNAIGESGAIRTYDVAIGKPAGETGDGFPRNTEGLVRVEWDCVAPCSVQPVITSTTHRGRRRCCLCGWALQARSMSGALK